MSLALGCEPLGGEPPTDAPPPSDAGPALDGAVDGGSTPIEPRHADAVITIASVSLTADEPYPVELVPLSGSATVSVLDPTSPRAGLFARHAWTVTPLQRYAIRAGGGVYEPFELSVRAPPSNERLSFDVGAVPGVSVGRGMQLADVAPDGSMLLFAGSRGVALVRRGTEDLPAVALLTTTPVLSPPEIARLTAPTWSAARFSPDGSVAFAVDATGVRVFSVAGPPREIGLIAGAYGAPNVFARRDARVAVVDLVNGGAQTFRWTDTAVELGWALDGANENGEQFALSGDGRFVGYFTGGRPGARAVDGSPTGPNCTSPLPGGSVHLSHDGGRCYHVTEGPFGSLYVAGRMIAASVHAFAASREGPGAVVVTSDGSMLSIQRVNEGPSETAVSLSFVETLGSGRFVGGEEAGGLIQRSTDTRIVVGDSTRTVVLDLATGMNVFELAGRFAWYARADGTILLRNAEDGLGAIETDIGCPRGASPLPCDVHVLAPSSTSETAVFDLYANAPLRGGPLVALSQACGAASMTCEPATVEVAGARHALGSPLRELIDGDPTVVYQTECVPYLRETGALTVQGAYCAR